MKQKIKFQKSCKIKYKQTHHYLLFTIWADTLFIVRSGTYQTFKCAIIAENHG